MKRFALLALAVSVLLVSPASAAPRHGSGHDVACAFLGRVVVLSEETGRPELVILFSRCTDGATHEKTVRLH
jgi:hypothetical protein